MEPIVITLERLMTDQDVAYPITDAVKLFPTIDPEILKLENVIFECKT